jgi:superfamily I DNA/RNA helicase
MSQTWWSGIQELKEEQKKIISLPLEDSHLVLGPPGSGKTNLLLLRANYYARAGHPNILLLVFTRVLREFIVTGGLQYAFDTSKVKTYRRWQYGLLSEYNADTDNEDGPEEANFDQQRAELNSQVAELVKGRRLHGIYDAILLDEAQDYLPEEIEVLAKLGKVLFVVADPRQKIYDGTDCFGTLKKVTSHVHQLHYNYRCGRNICKFADLLAKDSDDYLALSPKSQYDEVSKPSSVEYHACKDIDAEAKRIISQLALQLKAYPDDLLGVVCPTKKDVLSVWEAIEKSPLVSQSVLQLVGNYRAFDPQTRICVSTLHAAKGLEFRALHIAGCGGFTKFRANQRNIAYTAVTRAKTSLSLYYSGRVPAFLEQAFADMEPIKDLPNPKDLFGGRN